MIISGTCCNSSLIGMAACAAIGRGLLHTLHTTRGAAVADGGAVGPRTQTTSWSMPAAETFGQWAVAAAAARALQRRPATITAVGDCAPAASAINAASSGNAQMRHLVRAGRELSEQWLAVAIPREWNQDADRLSHPSDLPQVAQEAAAAGLRVTIAGIPSECWEALRGAVAAGLAASHGRRRKARHNRSSR